MIQMIQDAWAYLSSSPMLAVAFFMFLRNIWSKNQPFPTVDYGHVSTISSMADFKKCTEEDVGTLAGESLV